MNELIVINSTDLTVKEYGGQRVVTLKEVDTVHQRPEGTAGRNFRTNRDHFIEGTDFFTVDQPDEIRRLGFERPQGGFPEKVPLITESGYLMLVKSFTDDLAWDVQRQLVNIYFRSKTAKTNMDTLSPQLQLLISMELKQKEHDRQLAAVNQRVDGIREIVALSPASWREECRRLLAKVAQVRGGGAYQEVNAEVFKLVNERGSVSLETRLTNKRRRMADEGQCKSKRDKLSKVDVIADDKKLVEIYIAVVKEMAVKSGVSSSGHA